MNGVTEPSLAPEFIEKARVAQSAKELIALAEESGVALGEVQATALFKRLRGQAAESELAEEELANAAGGGCGSGPILYDCTCHSCKRDYLQYDDMPFECPVCGSTNVTKNRPANA